MRPTTMTNPVETLASRRIAWSYRLDLLALDRSVPEGYLMTTVATSGAFRPASDHIETKTHQICNSATACRSTRLIGHEPTRNQS